MKKLFFLFFATLLLAGCPKKDDPVANVREAAKDKDIQDRTFVSDCTSKLYEGIFNEKNVANATVTPGWFQRVSYKVVGQNITRTTKLYTTAKCDTPPEVTYEEKGTVKIDKQGGKVLTGDDGYNIDIDYDKVTVVAENDNAAEKLKGACGTDPNTKWEVKKVNDITMQAVNAGCYGGYDKDSHHRKVANIYRVDDKTLYLGTQTKGSVPPQERPKGLDRTTKFVAQ